MKKNGKFITLLIVFSTLVITVINCTPPMGFLGIKDQENLSHAAPENSSPAAPGSPVPIAPPPPGKGAVSISFDNLARDNLARDVLPDPIPVVQYKLKFSPVGEGCGEPLEETVDTKTNTSFLDPGTYKLEVIGYSEKGNPLSNVAIGVGKTAGGSEEFTIEVGSSFPLYVKLAYYNPLDDRITHYGTFYYDISFPDVSVKSMEMEISALIINSNASGRSPPSSPINLKTSNKKSIELDPGYYDLLITMQTDNGINFYYSEVIHIYQGMTSPFVEPFSPDYFPDRGNVVVGVTLPDFPGLVLYANRGTLSGSPAHGYTYKFITHGPSNHILCIRRVTDPVPQIALDGSIITPPLRTFDSVSWYYSRIGYIVNSIPSYYEPPYNPLTLTDTDGNLDMVRGNSPWYLNSKGLLNVIVKDGNVYKSTRINIEIGGQTGDHEVDPNDYHDDYVNIRFQGSIDPAHVGFSTVTKTIDEGTPQEITLDGWAPLRMPSSYANKPSFFSGNFEIGINENVRGDPTIYHLPAWTLDIKWYCNGVPIDYPIANGIQLHIQWNGFGHPDTTYFFTNDPGIYDTGKGGYVYDIKAIVPAYIYTHTNGETYEYGELEATYQIIIYDD